MKVTGYSLRDAIKEQELEKETAEGAFSSSLRAFPGETKDPVKLVERLEQAELKLCRLEVAQMRYNTLVVVEVQGEKMSLAEAIKRVGGAGRVEKMWKGAIQDKKNRFGDDEDYRDPTQVRPVRTIESERAKDLARAAGKKANAFRAAIATGNGREVDIESLDASLFG